MKYIPLLDIIALAWFIVCWIGYTVYSQRMSKKKGNLLTAMNEYRLNWMRQMLRRENRMMDATLLGNILRSVSFFASTTIFIIIGLFNMLKYHEEAANLLTEIPYAELTTPILWQTKIFLLTIIFVYAFFKYTWSLRQYDYTCTLIGAAPAASERNVYFEEYAQNAGRLIGNAARHFNYAMRGYYFGLAAFSWFINPWIFIVASAWIVLVLYRREFRSHALEFLLEPAIFKTDKDS